MWELPKKGYEALKASILVDSIGDAYADLLRQPEMEQNEGN